MTNENEQRQKALEMFSRMKATENQINEMTQQEQELVRSLNELTNAQTALEALNSRKKDDEKALLPLSAGVFVYADVPKIERVMVASGTGVMMDKTMPDTIELLKQRVEEVNKALEQVRFRLAATEHGYREMGNKLKNIQQGK